VAQEHLSASDGVADAIALKASDREEQQLIHEQVGYLQRQRGVQAAQQALLEQQRLGQAFANNNQRVQNIRERLRIVFEVGLALVVLVIAGVVVNLLFSAWHAQNVVIGAFDVPPAMEQQGLSGKAIASGLLDQLQGFQSETRASVDKRGITDAWTGDVRVEIPEAHISIGELQRYLRAWLGNETHIGGGIVQTAEGGLALTVRGNGFAAKTFYGKTAELPTLTMQAAEYIYGVSETYRFGAYLTDEARDEEAIELVKTHYGSALPSDKPLLLNLWGLALLDLGQYAEALTRFRQAVALKPDYWVGYNNIMSVQTTLGDEEGTVQTGLQMERMARRGQWFAKDVSPLYFQNLDLLRWDLPAVHDSNLRDMADSAGQGTGTVSAAASDAQQLAQMHDWQGALLALQTSPGAAADPYVVIQTDFVNGIIALDRGDHAAALAALNRLDAAVSASTAMAGNFIGPSCWLALAEEWNGQHDKAVADIERGRRGVDCYRFKANISDHHGDWALAQQQYAEAVALAPSIPSSYFSWGEALMRHGDVDGAIAKFTDANARGPHWADPLKSWGDALATRQDYKAAVARYAEAEKYAPNWGALHLSWGQALDKLGRHDAALEQYRQALHLDLSDAQRQSLEGCCA
jgi:tetratricopeptide (TPR) repeat protein